MTPREIFHRMFDHDPFSQWLGIDLLDIAEGHCTLRMTVRPEMLNGFGVAHGGITFSLADSAFAFACNSHGRQSVSIHCTVEHAAPVFAGDVLTAVASQDSLSNSISNYAIRVTNQHDKPVAFFRGVAFRKKTEWTDS